MALIIKKASKKRIEEYKLVSWIVREPREEPEGRPGGPGELKTARGGSPLALLSLPGPPGLPSGSSLGSLTIHDGPYEPLEHLLISCLFPGSSWL